MKKKIICTSCPVGCEIELEAEGEKIISITGNTCKRGEKYAQAEYLHPERMLTTSVKSEGGRWISVRSRTPLPKDLIFEVSRILSLVRAPEKVEMGQVIVKNILNTGVDIIATREVK